jgi:hypothetical protein
MIIDLADLAQLCLQAPHWRHHSGCNRLDEHALGGRHRQSGDSLVPWKKYDDANSS